MFTNFANGLGPRPVRFVRQHHWATPPCNSTLYCCKANMMNHPQGDYQPPEFLIIVVASTVMLCWLKSDPGWLLHVITLLLSLLDGFPVSGWYNDTIYIDIYLYIYTHVDIYTYIYIYIHNIYIHTYMYIYVCIHIYTYTRTTPYIYI